jgi:hypothetical protein
MKILVAGDSFAVGDESEPNCWSMKLRNILNCKVTNIGGGGTSLFWTWKQLKLQNWNNFDKIIVIVTEYGRGYTINSLTKKTINYEDLTVNYSTVLRNIEKINPKDPKYLEFLAVKLWYEHIYDTEMEIIKHRGILDKIILNIPPEKLILINGCCDKEGFSEYFKYDLCLNDIMNRELTNIWCDGFFSLYSPTNNINNHMMYSNNFKVANCIKDILEGKSLSFKLEDFDMINHNDLHLYYERF